MPPNGPPPRPGHIPDHPTSPPPPLKQNGAMSDNIEQLKAELRDAILEAARLQEQLVSQRVAHEDALNTLRKELERHRQHRQSFGHAPLDEPLTHSRLHSCQGVDGRYYYGLTQQQAVEVAMQAARDAREQMQNDCIRLYVVRGADGRNYYGQTLQEAARLANEGKYQLAEFAPGSGVPWQGQDGWEGKRAPVTKPPTAESI